MERELELYSEKIGQWISRPESEQVEIFHAEAAQLLELIVNAAVHTQSIIEAELDSGSSNQAELLSEMIQVIEIIFRTIQ